MESRRRVVSTLNERFSNIRHDLRETKRREVQARAIQDRQATVMAKRANGLLPRGAMQQAIASYRAAPVGVRGRAAGAPRGRGGRGALLPRPPAPAMPRGPIRMPRRGAANGLVPRGGRGAARGNLRGRGGVSRGARGGARGGRGRGRGRGRGGKPASKDDLDSELESYMMKDEEYAKSKLDSEMDAYMAGDGDEGEEAEVQNGGEDGGEKAAAE